MARVVERLLIGLRPGNRSVPMPGFASVLPSANVCEEAVREHWTYMTCFHDVSMFSPYYVNIVLFVPVDEGARHLPKASKGGFEPSYHTTF